MTTFLSWRTESRKKRSRHIIPVTVTDDLSRHRSQFGVICHSLITSHGSWDNNKNQVSGYLPPSVVRILGKKYVGNHIFYLWLEKKYCSWFESLHIYRFFEFLQRRWWPWLFYRIHFIPQRLSPQNLSASKRTENSKRRYHLLIRILLSQLPVKNFFH